ncbi:hypothetical protein K439DRAFT_1615739 [Ramaria rubella]|nr:hypothetical protein K439DRAFT_1615739 [Ramaria rubella]
MAIQSGLKNLASLALRTQLNIQKSLVQLGMMILEVDCQHRVPGILSIAGHWVTWIMIMNLPVKVVQSASWPFFFDMSRETVGSSTSEALSPKSMIIGCCGVAFTGDSSADIALAQDAEAGGLVAVQQARLASQLSLFNVPATFPTTAPLSIQEDLAQPKKSHANMPLSEQASSSLSKRS